MKDKNTWGGRRTNQTGRPKKPPGEKRKVVSITLRPDHYEKTAGNRSGLIEKALDAYLNAGWNRGSPKATG